MKKAARSKTSGGLSAEMGTAHPGCPTQNEQNIDTNLLPGAKKTKSHRLTESGRLLPPEN
jgi:hypothetical protein